MKDFSSESRCDRQKCVSDSESEYQINLWTGFELMLKSTLPDIQKSGNGYHTLFLKSDHHDYIFCKITEC